MSQQTRTLRQLLREHEAELLADAIVAHPTRQQQAQALGLPLSTYTRKLSEHGLI